MEENNLEEQDLLIIKSIIKKVVMSHNLIHPHLYGERLLRKLDLENYLVLANKCCQLQNTISLLLAAATLLIQLKIGMNENKNNFHN